MNKKITFAMFAVFAIMATSILTSVPVYASTPHGSTSSWDRGDVNLWAQCPEMGDTAEGAAWVSTGYMLAHTYGTAHADAYLNFGSVTAAANVNYVEVTVSWTSGYKYTFGSVNQARLECKLYVNGNYRGTEISSFPAASGEEDFGFSTSINTDDALDVDIKLVADTSGGIATLYGTFTEIEFVTP